MKICNVIQNPSVLGWFQTFPIDTGRKLNVHKTFRRRPGRLLNVLCTFNLRPVSTRLISLERFISLSCLNFYKQNKTFLVSATLIKISSFFSNLTLKYLRCKFYNLYNWLEKYFYYRIFNMKYFRILQEKNSIKVILLDLVCNWRSENLQKGKPCIAFKDAFLWLVFKNLLLSH